MRTATRRFRCLQHRFTVAADRPEDLALVDRAFASFAEDTAAGTDDGADGGATDGTDTVTRYHLGTTPSGMHRLGVDGVQERLGVGLATALDYLVWHVNDRVVRAEARRVLVHSGVLAAPDGGGLLLPARSGSGKSTTTLGLVQAGFGFLSDEFAVLDPDDGRVHPFPRPLSLKAGTLALQPGLADLALVRPGPGESAFVPAEAVRAGATVGAQEVRWVVFVRYEPGATAVLEPLGRAATMLRLAEHTFRFRARHEQAWPALERLARTAVGATLTTGSLADSVRLLSDLVGAPPRRPADPLVAHDLR